MTKYKTRLFVLICAVALVFTLSVPVFAAEETTMKIGGSWKFNETVSVPYVENTAGDGTYWERFDYSITAPISGVNYSAQGHAFGWINGVYLEIACTSDSTGRDNFAMSIYGNDGWSSDEPPVLTFMMETEVSYQFYQWLTTNAVRWDISSNEPIYPDYEGTTKPTTDMVKYNNVTLPNIEKVWTNSNYKAAAIVYDRDNDQYVLHVGTAFQRPYLHTQEAWETDNLCWYLIGDGCERYYCKLGDTEWTYKDYLSATVTARRSSTILVWASETIFTDSSKAYPHMDFFRPSPLTQMLAGVQMTAAMTEVVKLIPIMMVFLVGYKGFLKALQILEEILYRA